MKTISIVSGFCVLLCSVTHGVEDAKGNKTFEKGITEKQDVHIECDLSKEQEMTLLKSKALDIENLWKTIPAQKSSLRGCDAMPKEIEFSALFKGTSYKFFMTQYHDRKFGEMSELADFRVFLGSHYVGTFYSRSTSDVFAKVYDKK